MPTRCRQCGDAFVVRDDDLAFLEKLTPTWGGEKFALPPPALCIDCRQRQRIAFRNELSLYRRSCDATGQSIISMYPAGQPFPVYGPSAWWGDGWDGLAWGRDYRADRSFFPQFAELLRVVPKLALLVRNSENCAYNNEMDDCKNCYMSSTTFWGEDFYYCYWVGWGRDCVDCSFSLKNELCYECVDCSDCYHSAYLHDCHNCRDSHFLYDCSGCSDCWCCAGLRRKRWHFENEALSEARYREKLAELTPLTHEAIDAFTARLHALALAAPRKYAHIVNAENCVGDYIKNSRDCYYCFDIFNSQDLCYCFDALGRDFLDCAQVGPAERLYQVQSSIHSYNCHCSNFVWNCSDCLYCDSCFGCRSCFGCAGLRHKEYCILNKQYAKSDYQRAAAAIAGRMQSEGEWGEFFPMTLSPFPYNDSVAQQYFPLGEAEARAAGLRWASRAHASAPPTAAGREKVPRTIAEADDGCCAKVFSCAATGRPYKVIPAELRFYRTMGLPLPRCCPDERHGRRLAMRTPRKLWPRGCASCGCPLQSSYAPERSEVIQCEECYTRAK